MKKQNFYIIMCEDDDYKDRFIGFLPFEDIPKDSILRNAIFGPVEYTMYIKPRGIEGIYDDWKLAREHLKLEKKYRAVYSEEIKIIKI